MQLLPHHHHRRHHHHHHPEFNTNVQLTKSLDHGRPSCCLKRCPSSVSIRVKLVTIIFKELPLSIAFSFPMSIVWLSKLYSDDVFNDNESVQRLRVQDEERRKNAHRWISGIG